MNNGQTYIYKVNLWAVDAHQPENETEAKGTITVDRLGVLDQPEYFVDWDVMLTHSDPRVADFHLTPETAEVRLEFTGDNDWINATADKLEFNVDHDRKRLWVLSTPYGHDITASLNAVHISSYAPGSSVVHIGYRLRCSEFPGMHNATNPVIMNRQQS